MHQNPFGGRAVPTAIGGAYSIFYQTNIRMRTFAQS